MLCGRHCLLACQRRELKPLLKSSIPCFVVTILWRKGYHYPLQRYEPVLAAGSVHSPGKGKYGVRVRRFMMAVPEVYQIFERIFERTAKPLRMLGKRLQRLISSLISRCSHAIF